MHYDGKGCMVDNDDYDEDTDNEESQSKEDDWEIIKK